MPFIKPLCLDTNGNVVEGSGALETLIYPNGNSGTSLTINQDNGNDQTVVITGAVTIVVGTPTNPGKFTLTVTQDGSGHVYSFSGVKWPAGTQPTWSTAAGAIDVASFKYDGTNILGMGQTGFA